jgi:sensor histidine kinase regulating citrate/malate metabolism
MQRRYNLKKVVAIMVGITLLQTVGVAAITVFMMATSKLQMNRPELVALFFLALISVAGSMVSVMSVRPIIDFGSKLKQTEDSIEDLNKLNNTLRAQRHDFMNHLQVVYSLMELKDFEEAGRYIEKVYADIQKVSRVLKTSIPAVNAILQAKAQMCESRGIEAAIDVRSTLSDAAIPEWELCRVLGNIIDNAIHALLESGNTGRKLLKVEIFEDLRNHGFRITNNGPAIPPNLLDRIFEAGFTTRQQGGEGMGLTICREIMESCGGNLRVYSNNSEYFADE